MDLFTKFPTLYGKDCVFILIGQLTMYVHSFAIHLQYITPQEGKPLIRFHGPLGTTVSDVNGHFLEVFEQELLGFGYTELPPNTLYKFQAYDKLLATSKRLGNHLSYHFLRQIEAEL